MPQQLYIIASEYCLVHMIASQVVYLNIQIDLKLEVDYKCAATQLSNKWKLYWFFFPTSIIILFEKCWRSLDDFYTI